MKKAKPKCEVCFFQSSSKLKCVQMITCKGCKRSAHRYCYAPGSEEKQFNCDQCANKEKNLECCICHNQGLLKRTEEGEYAHPACLIFCRQSLVKSYKDLSFYLLRSKRKTKMGKCNICNKNSLLLEMFKCFQRLCERSAHYYCILKEQWKDESEIGKWTQDIRIIGNTNINYLELFVNRVKRYMKNFSQAVYKSIFNDANVVDQMPSYIIYCRDHCENVVNCYCDALEDANSKIDWIFCDLCAKWYHFHCEGLENDGNLEDTYVCRSCRAWEAKFEKNQEPIQKVFPRLQFYDFVRIQFYAESKNYRLSNAMKDLIKRVPFVCSIKNFTQNFKTKQMVAKVLKNANMMAIKKSLTEKAIKKGLQKLDKDLINVIWKLDFSINPDPIRAITVGKQTKFKMEQILYILQRYDKKHSEGSNIIRPVIKQFLKHMNAIKNKEEQSEGSQEEKQKEEIQEQVKELSQMMRNFIRDVKKCRESREGFTLMMKFYNKINGNEFLKELLKDYIEEKRQSIHIYEPIFKYESEGDMAMHLRVDLLYKQFSRDLLKDQKRLQLSKSAQHIMSLFSAGSKRFKKEIIAICRQLQCLEYEKENCNLVPNRRNLLFFKGSEKSTTHKILANNKRKQSSMFVYSQGCLTNLLKSAYFTDFFKNLQLKQNSLNFLYQNYGKLKDCINEQIGQNYENVLDAYLKLYHSSKKLIQEIYECETGFSEEEKLEIDMLAIIKNTRIQRTNMLRFCTFFIQIHKLQFDRLNQLIGKTLYSKGQEFFDLITSRSMIFQSQIEFKAAALLIEKYDYILPKIRQMMVMNKQLEQILAPVTLNSLQNLNFIDFHMKRLNEAKQFCQENNLQFRISKIQYMMKLYQFKEEAFRYFPVDLVVKNKQNLPKRYQNVSVPSSIDFYILKKFIYKMKLLKFPQIDHLYIKTNQLYAQKVQYYNTLSNFLVSYNSLLTNQPSISLAQENKFTRERILALIRSRAREFVTCEPEEEEITIICEMYESLLKRIEERAKSDELGAFQLAELRKSLMKFPFEPEKTERVQKIYSFLKITGAKESNQQAEEIHVLFSRKQQLDETSARGSQKQKDDESEARPSSKAKKSKIVLKR